MVDFVRSCGQRGHGIYLLRGKVTDEFGYASLEVEKMAKMPLQHRILEMNNTPPPQNI